jgi:hypothetical protein
METDEGQEGYQGEEMPVIRFVVVEFFFLEFLAVARRVMLMHLFNK